MGVSSLLALLFCTVLGDPAPGPASQVQEDHNYDYDDDGNNSGNDGASFVNLLTAMVVSITLLCNTLNRKLDQLAPLFHRLVAAAPCSSSSPLQQPVAAHGTAPLWRSVRRTAPVFERNTQKTTKQKNKKYC